MTTHSDFARRLTLMKVEAMRIGLPRTCHALEAAVKEVGWEMADILEGRQVNIADPQRKVQVAQLEAEWDVLSGDSEERIFNLEAERDAAKLQADLRLGVIEKLEAQLAEAQARIKELEG